MSSKHVRDGQFYHLGQTTFTSTAIEVTPSPTSTCNYPLTFQNSAGDVTLAIRWDGSVEVGVGADLDESARAFWAAVARYAPLQPSNHPDADGEDAGSDGS